MLSQEAKSAADRMRKGVGGQAEASVAFPAEVATSLDLVDDAVRALGAPMHHARRGRVDVAALLLELAPGAQLALEPGSGTAVQADPAELTRVMQVMLDLGTHAGGEPARVIRDGARVRVGVALGPDASASSRIEHAWLHRMAVRHGGEVTLDAGMIWLSLPADDPADREEVEELKKELAAAQVQGEAYARELASIFTRARSSIPPPPGAEPYLLLARLAGELAAELSALAEAHNPGRLRALSASLSRFAALDPDETSAEADPLALGKHAAAAVGAPLEVRASGRCFVPRRLAEAVVAVVAHAAVEHGEAPATLSLSGTEQALVVSSGPLASRAPAARALLELLVARWGGAVADGDGAALVVTLPSRE